MTTRKKEKRTVRLSGRITPALEKKCLVALKKLPKWTMSDLIEEGLMQLLGAGDLFPAR